MKKNHPKQIKIVAAGLIIVLLGVIYALRLYGPGQAGSSNVASSESSSVTTVVDRGIEPDDEARVRGNIADLETTVTENEANGTRDISVILNLANLYYQVGELGTAAKWYENILGTHPNDPPSLENLGQAQLEMGDYVGARKSWEAAVNVESLEQNYFRLADLIEKHFPEDRALIQGILETGISNIGQTPGLLSALGNWYASVGKYDEAISHYEVARTLSPKDESIKEMLAKLRADRAGAK